MLLKKIMLYKDGLLIYGLLLILLNIGLTQLPLTSTFGYEFAAVNGLILAILSGLHTFNLLNQNGFKLTWLIRNLLVLFFLPFVISVINSILTRFCSFADGLLFYLLIVSVSIVFGTALAFLITLITKKYCRILFIVIIVFIALIPIIEIYYYPQVYFYSPLIGFFPGNIYDEGLSPDLKLFFHQLLVTLFSVTIIYLVLVHKQLLKKKKYYFIPSIILTLVGFQFISTALGFNTTFSKLESSLPKIIKSDNFTLHYDKMDESDAAYIALNVEYYYLDLMKTLNVKPSKQIQIYLFNDRSQKKILFGAGNADVAKPWQYAIYISADSWDRTLKHELVHVFSAEFGTGIFKLASWFNPALIEGLAVAVEGATDDISITDFTSLAFNFEHKIDINSMLTGFNFFKSNSSLGYTYSGAFISYLIEKYGMEKAKKFYNNGNYYSVFNTNIKSDQKEFENKLNTCSFGNQAMADYYFGRLSILQKICPRFVADRLNNAYNYLNNNQLDKAEKLFNEINSKSINYSALIGLSEIYLQEKKIIKAVQILKTDLNIFSKTPYYYNLMFRIADLLVQNNYSDSAKYYYEELIIERPNYGLSFLANTRLKLLYNNCLKEYIEGEDSLKYFLLKRLSEESLDYYSISVLLYLSKRLKINYKTELKNFNKTFIVDNLESSYAAFILSQYMLSNGDYINGRKYAAISLRFENKNPFYKAMKENFEKAKWMFANANNVSESFIISNVRKD